MALAMAGLQSIHCPELLDGAHCRGGGSFRTLLHGELDRLPFTEGAETFHLNFGLVAKQVFAAIVRRNEAEAFCFIEPLDFTLHDGLCDLGNRPRAHDLGAPLFTELYWARNRVRVRNQLYLF